MTRFYLVPKIGTGAGPTDPIRPKYIADLGVPYAAIDYGAEGTFLVAADVTGAQHASIAANADVWAVPLLDDVVGGNPTLNSVRNELTSRSIPGAWVQATHTYRMVIGTTGRCCLVLQRIFGPLRKRRVFAPGVTLSTTLTAELLADFTAAADSFSVSSDGLSLALTVEEALLLIANRLPPFTLRGETV